MMQSHSSDVSWPLGQSLIHATLVTPSGAGPFPSVIMVAGSGPTDRDWCSPMLPGANGSAPLIAQTLAAHGIASLRYDKRGSGPNAAASMQHLIGKLSMASYVDEIAAAASYLSGHAACSGGPMFVLGNSEGTLHALNYAAGNPDVPLAGLILIAPPGRSVGVVARGQIAAQLAELPAAEQLLDRYDEAIARFMRGESPAPDTTLPAGVQMLLAGLSNPANLPFARELWLASATETLRTVDVPMLVIIGKKDIQVDWQLDGEPLREAARDRTRVSFLYPEMANHVLKREDCPRDGIVASQAASAYNEASARLDDDAMNGILGWIDRQLSL